MPIKFDAPSLDHSDITKQTLGTFVDKNQSLARELKNVGVQTEAYQDAITKLDRLAQSAQSNGSADGTELSSGEKDDLRKLIPNVQSQATQALRERDTLTQNRPSPIAFRDGNLTVEGTGANEAIAARQVGDQVNVEYARYFGGQLEDRQSLSVPVEQVKSLTINGGGGTDRIWNGDGQAPGIDGAMIGAEGDGAQIVNHGADVTINTEGVNRSSVHNFGDRAAIAGSGLIANSGNRANIELGYRGHLENTGNEAFVQSKGGLNSVRSRAPKFSANTDGGLPTKLDVVAEDFKFDRNLLGGRALRDPINRDPDQPLPTRPKNVPIPDDLTK